MNTNEDFQARLNNYIPVCLTFCMFAIVGDGAVNALYILESRSVDGTNLTDYLLTFGFLFIWIWAIRALAKFGLDVLPHAPKNKRGRVLPLWFAGMTLTACISIYMSSSFLGLGIAIEDYFSSKIQEINSKASSMIEAQRKANSLQVIFQSSETSANVLYEMEKNSRICL